MKPPAKPRPDFPLTPIGNGQWRKVVNGQAYYFGSWRDDPRGEAALKDWLARKDAIYAGLDHISRQLVPDPAELTVIELVRKYLKIRSADVEAGNLSPATFRDYTINLNDFCKHIGPTAKASGLKPQHFAAYRVRLDEKGTLGPHAIKRVIACIKAAFNYAMDEEWIKPVRFGRGFIAPDTSSEAIGQWCLRKGREDRTERILTRREIRKLLRHSKHEPRWRAMVLLMLNTGMNPAELARLKWKEIGFKAGRLRRRRWKTGIVQECYLWKRTRKALEALPHEHEDWVFIRKNGQPLVQQVSVKTEDDTAIAKVKNLNRVTRPFRDFAEAAGVKGITPYTLRRTARTVAANWPDDNAAKRMMGQRLTGRDHTYVKGKFPLARLHKISVTIYRRLFPKPTPPEVEVKKDDVKSNRPKGGKYPRAA